MENQFKLRISRIFRSSYTSCKPKNNTDIIERPIYQVNDLQHRQLIEIFSPKLQSFPSIPKSKLHQTFPRTKLYDRRDLLPETLYLEGQKCPPTSPITPFKTQIPEAKKKAKKSKKAKSSKRVRSRSRSFVVNDYYNGVYSSDEDSEVEEDDDKTTLFSSRSLSSDSSELSLRRGKIKRNRRKKESDKKNCLFMEEEKEEKVGFAVVKRSKDPYSDFRSSMVEMIMEKQMFGAVDLEILLQRFLLLNSHNHHRIIIQVFKEIWETLFANWS